MDLDLLHGEKSIIAGRAAQCGAACRRSPRARMKVSGIDTPLVWTTTGVASASDAAPLKNDGRKRCKGSFASNLYVFGLSIKSNVRSMVVADATRFPLRSSAST